ncbi:B-box zinc finger protein 22 [Ananas comosus]|uniref:B-box zinc finger protein 22 n=1 Tax=Ananas comosus TaxID=4615 RepID=A0A199W4G3_ANACO|nr:B-box zinc finger protein 22 [Ananas comosus]OAY84377.1 B-box zinc finger protein 22 [Ananas comosus]
MKIQCNACEAAEARVLCCADEAALCWACDEKVHAANKLAGKHERVTLRSGGASPPVPKCDICQESSGYFFCLEDRALFCRNCDVSIHSANPYVSAHQRFLVTGVQVGLEATEPVMPIANEQPNAALRPGESPSKTVPKQNPTTFSSESTSVFSGQPSRGGNFANEMSFSGGTVAGTLPNWRINEQLNSMARTVEAPSRSSLKRSSMTLSDENNAAISGQIGRDRGIANKMPFSGAAMTGNMPEWPLDDLLGFTEFNNNFSFSEHASSKADSGKLGSSDGSHRSSDEDLDADECLGQVPEIQWIVPEMPSPPTASGLHWQRNLHYPASENTAFVPDVSCSSPSLQRYFTTALHSKRQRRG